jgi:Holliday junction resolvase
MRIKKTKKSINPREYVTQQKSTEKSRITITTETLNKLWQEATSADKKPMLLLQLKDKNTTWNLYVDITKGNTL